MAKANTAETFWARAEKADPNSCWPWTGRLDRYGYGHTRFFGKRRSAHRVAFHLFTGEDPGLMAAAGEIGPMPSAAIFADTQAEPAHVYRWLDWLEAQLPFPVHRVTKGSLEAESLKQRFNETTGEPHYKVYVPAFFPTAAGRGIAQRKCTYDFKVRPLIRETKRLMKEAGATSARQWIGISLDEVRRMKLSQEPKIENRWPLVERRLSRWDCIRWMDERGFPQPPKSACVFCPYHSDAYWRKMKAESPAEFERAAKYEIAMQAVCEKGGARTKAYLHSSCQPITEVDFSSDLERGQGEMFGTECEGMCGV